MVGSASEPNGPTAHRPAADRADSSRAEIGPDREPANGESPHPEAPAGRDAGSEHNRFELRRLLSVEAADGDLAGPTDVRLVDLGARPGGELDVDLGLEDGYDVEAGPDPYEDPFEPDEDDDDWLADEDVRLTDLPVGTLQFSLDQADLEEPGLSEADPHPGDEEPVRRPWAARADRRYGDRVEGWVRPEYRDEPVTGDYWTPIPDAGYGWPVPVERIPAVPPYPPASGFDPVPEAESEPTAVVPQWPPVRPDDRIGLPRAWSEGERPAGRRFPKPLAAPGRRRDAEQDRNAPDKPSRRRNAEQDRIAPDKLDAAGRRVNADRNSPEQDRIVLDKLDAPGRRSNANRNNTEQDRNAPDRWRNAERNSFDKESAAPDELAAPRRRRDEERTASSTEKGNSTDRYAAENSPRDRGSWNRGPERRRWRDDDRDPAADMPRLEGGYAGREVSVEGPVWTVPDLPEAAVPDLTWPGTEVPEARRRRPQVMAQRPRNLAGEPTQNLPAVTDDRVRPRPRPRPRPEAAPDQRSTVYVSKHAADPS